MDRTAFWHYLTFIVAPAPLTMFRGIFKLPAGHVLTIDHARRGHGRGSTGTARPIASTTLTERDISEPEAVAELTRLLKQSIARRMVSDVPFGVLLSGGVDSSMNVALMSELMDAAGHDVHDRLRGQRGLQRVPVRAADQPALQDRPSRDADQPGGDAEFPAAAGPAAGRADRRQRLHPAVLPRASW